MPVPRGPTGRKDVRFVIGRTPQAAPSHARTRGALPCRHKPKTPHRHCPIMKRVHVWENHVSIPHLDLVLVRPATESLAQTLGSLSRMGIGVEADDVEVHDHVRTD